MLRFTFVMSNSVGMKAKTQKLSVESYPGEWPTAN